MSTSSSHEWDCFTPITQMEKLMHRKIAILVQNDTIILKCWEATTDCTIPYSKNYMIITIPFRAWSSPSNHLFLFFSSILMQLLKSTGLLVCFNSISFRLWTWTWNMLNLVCDWSYVVILKWIYYARLIHEVKLP